MFILKALNIFPDRILTHFQSLSDCPVSRIALIYFSDFNKSNSKNFEKINCQMKSFGYKVLKDENKKPILCEQILFSDLQSFLFYDFFNGIRNNYIPNKCKNDPIWQTYNRAYKAHYARYMKKKMTISEFEKWSRFASSLRDKAIAGEVKFEQYYVDIRK